MIVSNPSALRADIQRTLHGLASSGRFFRVLYGSDGLPDTIDPDSARIEHPASNLVNEVSANYSRDRDFGRDVAMRKTSWIFEQMLGFDCEVTAAFFEADVSNPVPRLARSDFHSGAMLLLTSAVFKHPTTDGNAGGSLINLTWEAIIGR